jgi:hypothetical protein
MSTSRLLRDLRQQLPSLPPTGCPDGLFHDAPPNNGLKLTKTSLRSAFAA